MSAEIEHGIEHGAYDNAAGGLFLSCLCGEVYPDGTAPDLERTP